jgi:ProP effector
MTATDTPVTASPSPAGARRQATQAAARAVLARLAELYPRLFGPNPRPLKRGIFQDLLAAHPDGFDKDALKAALALHTRATRYLLAMASR